VSGNTQPITAEPGAAGAARPGRFGLSKGTIGFAAGIVALVAAGLLAYSSDVNRAAQAEWVSHTNVVLRSISALTGTLQEAQSEQRLFVLSDNATYLFRRDSLTEESRDELRALRRYTADNPAQQARLDSLASAMTALQAYNARVSAVRQDSGVVAAAAVVATGQGELMLDASERTLGRMSLAEDALLAERQAATAAAARRTALLIALSTALGVAGFIAALLTMRSDVTMLRDARESAVASEAKFRTLLESAADAIFVFDERTRCVEANACAASLVGYPRDAMIGMPLGELLAQDEKGKRAAIPMLRIGQPTTRESVVRRADGTPVPVEVSACLLEDGRIEVIARDITERRELDRLKGEFVSVVSHELRTPLTSIRGALGLLASGRLAKTPHKAQHMIDLAVANTDRLVRLINDILDVERIESGAVAMDRRPQDALALANRAADFLRPVADAAHVRIRVSGEPVRVWADEDRIVQGLTNLLGNAVKFSATSGVVELTVRRHGDQALIEVRDHGRGIPADKLERIFDRFQQVDASDSREKGGTGLGLAITRSIVRQHGGRIWAESELGQGSRFRFTIPLAEERTSEYAVANGATAGESAGRVLVVEDDVELAHVMATTLESRGLLVDVSHNGLDAERRLTRGGPDLLLLDVALPDMTGVDLLDAAKTPDGKRIPVLVYTAVDLAPGDRARIANVGGVVVTKGRTAPETIADHVLAMLAGQTVTRADTPPASTSSVDRRT